MFGRVAVLAVVAACSSSTGSMIGDAALSDAPTGSTDPGVQRYIGQLAMSATVPFGGSPYCNYSMTLKTIVIDVSIHPTRGLTTMMIGDTTTEAIVGMCPYSPSPPSRQEFAYAGNPKLPNGNGTFDPALVAETTNQPTTALTTSITRMSQTLLGATARWQRTDQAPILNWVVATSSPVQLQRVACKTNDLYCLGDNAIGALYGCTDGLNLVEVKPCTSGCAPTQQPPGSHINETCN